MCFSSFQERKLFCLARFAPTMQVYKYVTTTIITHRMLRQTRQYRDLAWLTVLIANDAYGFAAVMRATSPTSPRELAFPLVYLLLDLKARRNSYPRPESCWISKL